MIDSDHQFLGLNVETDHCVLGQGGLERILQQNSGIDFHGKFMEIHRTPSLFKHGSQQSHFGVRTFSMNVMYGTQ